MGIYNYQLNQFQNSFKVKSYYGFDNDMIDYGIIIINEVYSVMDDATGWSKYISNSFNLKYTKWSFFIFPFGEDISINSYLFVYYVINKLYFLLNKY